MATKKSTSKTAKKTKTLKSTKSAPKKPAPKKSEYCHVSHFVGGTIILAGIIILAAMICSIICFCFPKSSPSDAEKFSAEYSNVEKDNLFVYRTGEEIIDILEHGTGVIFLGFPSCPWCQAYAPMLNSVAKEASITEIYYHNTYDDWKNNTAEYQKITEILSSNLQYDDNGNRHLYVPDTVFVKDGVIIGNDFETSKDTEGADAPEDYWTEERVAAFRTRITNYLAELK